MHILYCRKPVQICSHEFFKSENDGFFFFTTFCKIKLCNGYLRVFLLVLHVMLTIIPFKEKILLKSLSVKSNSLVNAFKKIISSCSHSLTLIYERLIRKNNCSLIDLRYENHSLAHLESFKEASHSFCTNCSLKQGYTRLQAEK
jgi:hypothetical protein